MSVKLRLARRGRKNSPYYRLVVADARFPRDGRFIDDIGYYQPLRKDAATQLNIDQAKALKWLHDGAIPSDTVRSLLRRKGIMKQFHEDKVAARKAAKAAAN
ncbi:30S ribosomal protein S16 [Candidatus Sumerlaeota bacterium]|nr:30S ribosomal protein S16 [Candidatus Sumerlaeota bacterium]